jgi:hypothetical protein
VRDAITNYVPDKIIIHAEVVMDQAIAHSGHCSPVYAQNVRVDRMREASLPPPR